MVVRSFAARYCGNRAVRGFATNGRKRLGGKLPQEENRNINISSLGRKRIKNTSAFCRSDGVREIPITGSLNGKNGKQKKSPPTINNYGS